jgi:3-methyladenine DNA glycosylase AlkD
VEELVRTMRAAADPEAAAVLTRFFQVRPGGYGEGDQFIGLKLSQLRGLAKPYVRTPFRAADWLPLLQSPVHEDRQVALVVMTERATRAARTGSPVAATELELVYRTYRANAAYVNNWDLVDLSCGPIVGGFLSDRDRAPLYDLVRSPSLWERRIAIVASQHFLRSKDSADLYRLAALLLDDREDLLHKAVGWSLREAGKRVDRDELCRFLDRYATVMPRTALRYAIEHFDEPERQHYLKLR